jgi:hypothetical protein
MALCCCINGVSADDFDMDGKYNYWRRGWERYLGIGENMFTA